MLLIPNENLRANTEFTFTEITDKVYEFLQDKADVDFKPDIAISDEDFKKFSMHSAVVTFMKQKDTLWGRFNLGKYCSNKPNSFGNFWM